MMDETVIDSLMIWAKVFCIRPRLEFRSDEHGRVFCDVFPTIGDMMHRNADTPLTTTQAQ